MPTDALIGHDFNPAAHPIARNVIGWLAMSLQYMAVPCVSSFPILAPPNCARSISTVACRLVFHYWLTRRVSTGLPLAWWLAQTVSDLIYHIVHSLTNFEYYSAFLFITKILGFALLIVVQLRLLSGIEVKLVDWVPTAVRLRPRTESELRSRQDDSRFDWKLRAVVRCFLLLFFSLHSLPLSECAARGPCLPPSACYPLPSGHHLRPKHLPRRPAHSHSLRRGSVAASPVLAATAELVGEHRLARYADKPGASLASYPSSTRRLMLSPGCRSISTMPVVPSPASIPCLPTYSSPHFASRTSPSSFPPFSARRRAWRPLPPGMLSLLLSRECWRGRRGCCRSRRSGKRRISDRRRASRR